MVIDGSNIPHTSVVSDDTELVIEGLARCGNTFAVVAFHLAQERIVNVAHHLHAEAQIIQGVVLGIPVVLLVRDPEDVVVSIASSFGYPVNVALRNYVKFYSKVLPYRGQVVIADFNQLTTNFGGVIEAVNAKFGTSFQPFSHTKESVDKCFGVIDEFYRRTAPEPNRTLALPTEQRSASKEALRFQYQHPENASLREAARRLYNTLVEQSIAV